jgi:integrase
LYKVQHQQNGVIAKEDKNIPLYKILNLYAVYADNNNKDKEHKNSKIETITNFFKANTPVQKIKRSDIENFRTFLLKEKNLSNSTVNKYVCVLSKAFNLAIDNNLILYNPCKGLKKLKENNEILRYLTTEEETALFKELPEHLKPIVICALQTCLRRGNILNLQWEQIDVEFRFIEIEKQQNKGHKEIRIPISDKLMEQFIAIGIKDKGYVFINPETNRPYNTIKKGFLAACERAGIENFRFHDLRHTVGTRLIEKGVDVKTVQELFAHSSIATTQRYTHTSTKRKIEAIEVLNSYN